MDSDDVDYAAGVFWEVFMHILSFYRYLMFPLAELGPYSQNSLRLKIAPRQLDELGETPKNCPPNFNS